MYMTVCMCARMCMYMRANARSPTSNSAGCGSARGWDLDRCEKIEVRIGY